MQTSFTSLAACLLVAAALCVAVACDQGAANKGTATAPPDTSAAAKDASAQAAPAPPPSTLDTADYNARMLRIANGDTTGKWPVKNAPYPLPGAILPFKRVVAYYGNLYSKKMGALGQYPPDEMKARLMKEVAKWQAADSLTPVVPALHYIASVAQESPSTTGKYTMRMPDKHIDSVLVMAKSIDGLVFLDLQVAHSTVQEEIPRLEKYLMMPHVHLGLDPEFSMKDGTKPGKKVGTYDAADINWATNYLAELVRKHNLPPKMLVVHRFTKTMLTNSKNIKLRPEVQVVIDMDGWGFPLKKINTHKQVIFPEPVQFTGFKIFYKNDNRVEQPEMQPADVLSKIKPDPVYIQYQ